MDRRQFLSTATLVTVIGGSGVATALFAGRPGNDPVVVPAIGIVPTTDDLTFRRATAPDRTVAYDRTGTALATFTDNARTVAITGPARTFTEPRFTTATVTTNTWVRLAPQPWTPGAERAPWFRPWFTAATTSTAPDILAIAMQYTDNAPNQHDPTGLRYAGDATYGPDSVEGKLENSDFYDYLGIDWTFPDGTHAIHTPQRYGSLDCSGFVRIVYGYRSGYPLLPADTPAPAAAPGLPRRAWAISTLAPGAQIIPDRGIRATDYSPLQAGDLLLFNLEPFAGSQITHVGIYLGVDNAGHRRLISSRRTANGPSLGDAGGTSALDREGTYSSALRAAKRL